MIHSKWKKVFFLERIFINYIKYTKGPVFIRVKSDITETLYKMVPEFFTKMKNRNKNKISAGNSGLISYNRQNGGNTTVTFSLVVCDKCDITVK